jgi:paraquat-inducible protein A
VLNHARSGRLNEAQALNFAAIIFFLLANTFPVATIQATGNTVHATLIGVAEALHAQNMNLVALVVIGTTIVFPGLDLFCTCTLLFFAKWRRLSAALVLFFRLRNAIKPWSMVEIFVLGTLVAIVKLGSIASVDPEIGFWSLCAFIVLSAATSQAFDPVEFWSGTTANGQE